MSSVLPYMILMQDDTIGMIFEHIDYRIIYMNGKHPGDILDYPEWEGHSIGRWEGDTLVIDTSKQVLAPAAKPLACRDPPSHAYF